MSVSRIACNTIVALAAILVAAGLAVSGAHSANAATTAYTGTTKIYASNVNAQQALAKANTLVLVHGDAKCPAPSAALDGLIVNRTAHECYGISRMGKPGTLAGSRYIVFTVKAHGQW